MKDINGRKYLLIEDIKAKITENEIVKYPYHILKTKVKNEKVKNEK